MKFSGFRYLVIGGMFALLLGGGAFCACKKSPPHAESGTATPLSSPALKAFVDEKARCQGKIVSQFSEADAGDSVRSNPEHILNPNHPAFQSVSTQFCVETMPGSAPATPIRIAIENARLKDGRALITRNTGWESVSLVYQFFLPGDSHDIQDTAYWNQQASDLMKEAAGFSRSTITEVETNDPNLGHEGMANDEALQAAGGFAKRAQNPAELKDLSAPVILNDSEIQLKSWIEEVRELPGGKGRFVEIVVSLGPL